MKRVVLIEKAAGDVGEGKPHCMLVSLDQLAELMYRVRDAKWVSGTATTSDGSVQSVVTFTSTSPPTEKVEWELQAGDADSAYTRRGYVAETNDTDPARPMDSYGPDYFSGATYLTVGGTNGGSTNPLAYREAVMERSIWADAEGAYEAGVNLDAFLGVGYGIGVTPSDTFKTGFSFFGTSWTDSFVEPTIYAPFSTYEDLVAPTSPQPYYGAAVVIRFTGEVAWVDENGSGNPFDPLNKLYVGMFFGVRNSFDGTIGDYSHSSDLSALNSPASGKLADLKLKLSGVGNYITAAIYGWNDYSGGSGATASATDWIFEATEWFPYAKTGGPVWEFDTGAKA